MKLQHDSVCLSAASLFQRATETRVFFTKTTLNQIWYMVNGYRICRKYKIFTVKLIHKCSQICSLYALLGRNRTKIKRHIFCHVSALVSAVMTLN